MMSWVDFFVAVEYQRNKKDKDLKVTRDRADTLI